MRIGNVPIRIDGARVTAMDVARQAGVSQPTVSLVLSNNPKARVAEATRRARRQVARSSATSRTCGARTRPSAPLALGSWP